MTNQEIIGRLEALKSQHRTGAAVLLEAAQHFIRAVESQRDVECQDIDRLIRSIGGALETPEPAAAPVPDSAPETAAPAANLRTPEQEKQLADLRAACVRKAAAGGQKAILAFLQAHKVRSVFDLDPALYSALMFICKQEA